MKKSIEHTLTFKNKKFTYELIPASKKTSWVKCKVAHLSQEFLNEDIPKLLNDLPNLITAEQEYHAQKSEMIRFRISQEDKKQIEKIALKKGYSSISKYLRSLALGHA